MLSSRFWILVTIKPIYLLPLIKMLLASLLCKCSNEFVFNFVPVYCYHGGQEESCYMEVEGMNPENNPKALKTIIHAPCIK